ncbi:MAG: STAS domain-containing protein [Nitrosomonadales bacterium]|nr:MAG: STAS domain-containing protein [Nitrosomonadales bacterium]
MIAKQGSRLVLSGAMTMQTVNALLAEAVTLLTDAELEMDLGQVTEVDSAAVSLLFEWLRLAHGRKASLTFANMPATLVSLVSLYGVDGIIPHRTH